MKLKNENIKISELGEERAFVSGTKNWRKVSFFDEDDHELYTGNIDWMIVTEDGYVEVSIADTPLGRIDLEEVDHVK